MKPSFSSQVFLWFSHENMELSLEATQAIHTHHITWPARHKVQAGQRTQKEGSSLVHVESEADRAWQQLFSWDHPPFLGGLKMRKNLSAPL